MGITRKRERNLLLPMPFSHQSNIFINLYQCIVAKEYDQRFKHGHQSTARANTHSTSSVYAASYDYIMLALVDHMTSCLHVQFHAIVLSTTCCVGMASIAIVYAIQLVSYEQQLYSYICIYVSLSLYNWLQLFAQLGQLMHVNCQSLLRSYSQSFHLILNNFLHLLAVAVSQLCSYIAQLHVAKPCFMRFTRSCSKLDKSDSDPAVTPVRRLSRPIAIQLAAWLHRPLIYTATKFCCDMHLL